MKSGDKISTYNVDFIRYVSQLGWENSVLCHCYYQRLSNQIQNPISTWEQGKPTLFQDMYTLAMTINYCSGNKTANAIRQDRWRKRPSSLTPRSKKKLPPPVLPWPPRTQQIHLQWPHPPRTLPLSHLHSPLPKSNLILHGWTSLPSWPAMAS